MNRNLTIAAAVAAALAGGTAHAQAGLTAAQIAAAPAANQINIAGSSAIKTALTNTIIANFCGGAATPVTSNGSNTNFLGIACTPAAGKALNSGLYAVWIRYEGGSVTGYLPFVNGVTINEIQGSALTAIPITINGNSEVNGQDDSFTASAGGALVKVTPDLGIGDVEAKALINANYPKDYSTGVWGAVNNGGMAAQATSGLVDEVYALFVNETTTPNTLTESPLNLNQEMIANILTHKVTDWSQVYDINGAAVASGSTPITIVNREFGSGSRATADILMAGDSCGSAGVGTTLFSKAANLRYFSTGDVLKAAGSIPGAITYATIDNNPATNLTMVSVSGVAPSNLAAAQGNYPYWVEAQYVNHAAANSHDATAVNSIVSALQNEATTAALADINAIPSVVNASGTPTNWNTTVHINAANSGVLPTGGGTATVYINPFTRAGTTCSNPSYGATVLP
jgi:hypothetical protein